MKDKKDISDLIRDNEHKLEERPSTRTWERLEGKLDNRRSRGNTFLYRQIAMAAAVIALVAVISLITVLSDKQNSQFAKAAVSNSIEDWIVQDLETVYTDANTNVRLVIEFQKELKARYANPIQEGDQTKKLVASNKTFTGSVNRPEELIKKMLTAKNSKNQVEADVIAMEENELTSIEAISNNSKISPPNTSVSEAKISDDLVKNYLTVTQQMEWIIGAWRENDTLVEWQKVNKSTILCDEFLLKEKRKIGLQLIDSRSQQSYDLVSEEGDKKIFSNKDSDRVILKNVNPNKFTMTFLPAQGVKKVRTFTK
jgi:hypothetical protein